jgi:hypothetical protein
MCHRGCSPRRRPAFLLEAGEIPAIWKIATLPGFDRLNDTIAIAQEDALAIPLLHQRQTATIPGQSQVSLNEFVPR